VAISPASLEKAIRAGQDAETDTSSTTRTPTEGSGSNPASPPSSASSTPRLVPSRNDSISSCCQPKNIPQPRSQPAQQGGCCGSKKKQIPEPVQVKSCCSGSKVQQNTAQPHLAHHLGQQYQFQLQPQAHIPQYSNMQPPSQTSFPFGFGAPIYNHAAAAYHQSSAVAMGPVSTGPLSPHIPGPQIGQHVPEHNCHCGESCSCFGCAAHPNNATMMEYVRLMAQFQYTGGFGTLPPPLYDMPTYPHHSGYGAEAHRPMNFNAINTGFSMPTPTQMTFNASIGVAPLPNIPIAVSTAWQQPSVASSSILEPQSLEPSSYGATTPSSELHSLKIEETAATPIADSPGDSREEETPTLSPSSYFWNQMVLPGCDDATGTCQCGDGCECVGCLTHGGHNGVPLVDAPTTSEQSAFPDFTADSSLQLDDAAHFLFSSAPA
jgi:hypothetical protein